MLTADQVRAQSRGGQLVVRPLSNRDREAAKVIATDALAIWAANVGNTREELEEALDGLSLEPKDKKLATGLFKLLEDHAEFTQAGEGEGASEPAALRRTLFEAAARARREGHFDRDRLIGELGPTLGLDSAEVERRLFADLREAQELTQAPAIGAEALVAEYEHSQVQAVLLRALRVQVDVTCATPAAYRAMFRRLKFLQLLFRIERHAGGYRLSIDGPYALFDQVTKYGLKLALLVPVLEGASKYHLEADVLWGKTRERLHFEHEGGGGPAPAEGSLPEEVAELKARFVDLKSDWDVEIASDLLDLPGVGLCIPDLAFRNRERGERAYLEVMGHWSRAAVWARVELVEKGLPQRIVFAVSNKLRVSEEVLGDDLPSSLYVYKGQMNARSILERLERRPPLR